MEQEEFVKLLNGLIIHLEEKNLIILISEKNIINESLNNLFIDCENYDKRKSK
jgi:hypothetical protein